MCAGSVWRGARVCVDARSCGGRREEAGRCCTHAGARGVLSATVCLCAVVLRFHIVRLFSCVGEKPRRVACLLAGRVREV